MAKKARVVAAITGQKIVSPEVLNSITLDTSPWPPTIAHRPIQIMIRRPVSSTRVRTTFIFTLSPTPRRLIAATPAMKTRPMSVIPMPPVRSRPKAFDRLAAKAREAVDADVIPEHMTAKATMNVTK